MGFSGREASWTAVVLYRFSLERAEAEDKDSRAAHPVRAAQSARGLAQSKTRRTSHLGPPTRCGRGTVCGPSTDREPSRFAACRQPKHAGLFQTTSAGPPAADGGPSAVLRRTANRPGSQACRQPKHAGLFQTTSTGPPAADGGPSAVLRWTANRPGSQRVASPNTLGFFRPLQQGHVLRTGTVRGPQRAELEFGAPRRGFPNSWN